MVTDVFRMTSGCQRILSAASVVSLMGCGRAGFETIDLRPESEEIPGEPTLVELGGSATGKGLSQSPTDAFCSRIALAPDGTPYSAWLNVGLDGTTWDIYVGRFDGSSWVGLGGSNAANGLTDGSASGTGSCPGNIAFDSSGRPWIVFMYNRSTYVQRWNGMSWEIVGTPSPLSGAQTAWWPSMAFDSSSRATVVWSAFTAVPTPGAILLRRWDGSVWQEVGNSATGAGLAEPAGSGGLPHLLPGPSNSLFVSWWDDSQHAYMKRWDGADWVELAGSATGDGISGPGVIVGYVGATVDHQGDPYVAWVEGPVGGEAGLTDVHVRHYDGTTWELIPSLVGGGVAADFATQATLQIAPSGDLLVAFVEQGARARDVQIARWDGSNWSQPWPAGLSESEQDSTWPGMQVSSRGEIYVAWVEALPEGSQVYAKRLAP